MLPTLPPASRLLAPRALLTLLALLAGAAPTAARAQEYPLLDSSTTHRIAAEISGDAAYDHLRTLTQLHRPQGSDTLMVAARYVERAARSAGLAEVRVITLPSTRTPWNPGTSDLWIVSGLPERIASSIQNRVHLADRSSPAELTAELVDVGRGTPDELRGRDLAGKIVLTTGDLNGVMADAVQRRGAAGVVWYPDPYTPSRGYLSLGVDLPDAVPWMTLSTRAIDGRAPTFAFVLSLRQGIALRNRLAAPGAPLRVRAVVRSVPGSRDHASPSLPMVEAMIRGSDPSLAQHVVLTAHLQEEQHSANDDGSGIASLLEIGRALTRLIADGTLPRPRRTIRFWWTTENDAERQYFAAHPRVLDTLWVNVNQDMVGADQALDVMRTQDVTRLPAARFHFLNDVMEAVVDYLVAGNSANISQYRNGQGLYPRPHLSHNGTRHRYNAQAVWYFGDSDHQSFLDAGIPATTFTNSPDRYIHTNLDDLFQVDRTQLGRNAAAAALIAYTMADAGDTVGRRIAAEVVGRGRERLGGSVRLALQFLATWPDREEAYQAAEEQVRYGAGRERRALTSLAQISPAAAALVPGLLAELDRREAQALREVRAFHASLGGGAPARRPLSAEEAELARLRPARVASPREWLDRYDQIGWSVGINPYMAREVIQSIDGTRSGLDILRLVAAEAREGGRQYYGAVPAAAVLRLLRDVERLGLYRMR